MRDLDPQLLREVRTASVPVSLGSGGCGGATLSPGDTCTDTLSFDPTTVSHGRYTEEFWLKDASYNLLRKVA